MAFSYGRGWKRVVAVLCGLLAPTLWGAGIGDPTFHRAETLYRNGSFLEAVPLYEQVKAAQKGSNTHLKASLRLGDIYLRTKAYAKARREFLSAAKQFPKSNERYEMVLGLAVVEWETGQPERAQRLLKKLPRPLTRVFPQRTPQVLELEARVSLAAGEPTTTLRNLDLLFEGIAKGDRSFMRSELEPLGKEAVKKSRSRSQLESLRATLKDPTLQEWVSLRLGRGRPGAAREIAGESRASRRGGPDRARVELLPRLYQLTAQSRDRTTGSGATLVSGLNPGVRLRFALILGRLEPYLMGEFALVTLSAPEGRTLSTSTPSAMEFGVGTRFFFDNSKRFYVSGGLGAAREILFRATSVTEIALDGVLVPRVEGGAGAELVRLKGWSLGVSAFGALRLGVTSSFHRVTSGTDYGGQAMVGVSLSDKAWLRAAFVAQFASLVTTFETRSNESLGTEIGFLLTL